MILGQQSFFYFYGVLVNVYLKGLSLAAQDQPCQEKQECLHKIRQIIVLWIQSWAERNRDACLFSSYTG